MNSTSEKLSRKAGRTLSALALANLAMQSLLAGGAVAAPTPQPRLGAALDLAAPAAAKNALPQQEEERFASTRAVGEEGGSGFGMATTLALGEETGGWGGPTTYALGEEGGVHHPRPPQIDVTTYAIGEEGGVYPRPPHVSPRPPQTDATTLAVGEEGGGWGGATTYAFGEEGGVRPHHPRPPVHVRPTTLMIGEEGGHYNRPAPPPLWR